MKRILIISILILSILCRCTLSEGYIIDDEGNIYSLDSEFEIEIEEDYSPEYYNKDWIMSRIEALGEEGTASIVTAVFLAGIIQYYYEDPSFREDYWYISDYELILLKLQRLESAFDYAINELPDSISLVFSDNVQLIYHFNDENLLNAVVSIESFQNYDGSVLRIVVN